MSLEKSPELIRCLKQPLVSVIIPCRIVDELVREAVFKCLRLEYRNFEVILLPDDPFVMEGVVVAPTGPVLPGRKRNIGASVAKGDVLAYIDSDAYPRGDWLLNAVRYLQDEGVGAVGGPGLTPPEDGEFAHAQGAILSSSLVGGSLASRYKESEALEVDDIHSVNFVAWRKAVEEAGGWNEQFWPGEDTLMSLHLKKTGYKQLLASDVVVYHHRRRTWGGYLAQIWNYGLHRGYFAKHFPENSRRLGYFFPAIFLVCLILAPILSFVFNFLWLIYLAGIVMYLFVAGFVALRNGSRKWPMILIGIPLTHAVYGAGFLGGLAARELRR